MQICSCHDSRSRRGHYTDRYHGPVHRLVSMHENAGASRRVQKFGYIYRHGNFSERISSDLLNGARFLLASARAASTHEKCKYTSLLPLLGCAIVAIWLP